MPPSEASLFVCRTWALLGFFLALAEAGAQLAFAQKEVGRRREGEHRGDCEHCRHHVALRSSPPGFASGSIAMLPRVARELGGLRFRNP